MSEKRVDLRHGNSRAGQQLRAQQEPARERAHQQRAHIAHLPVVDHGQRRLQAAEQQDHGREARRDIHLIADIRAVGLDRRQAECGAKARREDKQPDERAHQGGHETLPLMEKPHVFPPRDADETPRILNQAQAVLERVFSCYR
jgi:hypothetical protein